MAWFLEKLIVKESEAALTEHLFLHNGWIDPKETAEIPTSGAQLATPDAKKQGMVLLRDSRVQELEELMDELATRYGPSF